ncbi:hypothetical protein PVL30_001206 [Lodderomyces elongisporus]|uniref:uncharacterized protein n=1 Tax=Lodderomyces elongisporus TaxID=36914 RepID=UPI0029260B40|nr:uncharacterized protein PVL30_001206 [Lodderomyces elongisporus]WLF77488.1 hypothetical protein PVL30_001206 [Lodderomyces elongisporus]
MPPKRKVSTGVSGPEPAHAPASGSESPQLKKQKPQQPGKHSVSATKKFYQSTLDRIHTLQEGDELLAAAFIKLPSKKFYPDYYHLIKRPVSVNEIQKRVNLRYTGESTSEFLDDFKLLWENAATYNDVDSWIVKNAKKLFEFVQDQVAKFENTASSQEEEEEEVEEAVVVEKGREIEEGADATSEAESGIKKLRPTKLKLKIPKHNIEAPSKRKNNGGENKTFSLSTLTNECLNVLEDVIKHEFKDIGVLSYIFMEEVDQSLYTDYSKYVKKPMAFNTVKKLLNTQKLFNSKQSLSDNLQIFHDTVALIFSNARAYNNEGSQISHDATLLEKYFETQYGILKTKVHEVLEKQQREEDVQQQQQQQQQQQHPKLKISLTRPSTERKTKKVKDEPKVSQTEQTSKSVSEVKKEEKAQHLQNHEAQAQLTQVQPATTEAMVVAPPSVSTLEKTSAEVKSSAEVAADKTAENTMGRSEPTLLESNLIIQESSIYSSPSLSQHLAKYVDQQVSSSILSPLVSRESIIKQALFPTLAKQPLATMFSYKFPANGFVDHSYSVVLPADVSPFISFKVSLHHHLFLAKEADLIDGHGYLNSTSDEDFQCNLYVNDEEVIQPNDCFAEKKENSDESVLAVQYDIKLSPGLNVLSFECKVAPALSKKVKNTVLQEQPEEFSGSRHTRHQLQQMKMSWDVETVNFYVVCSQY